MVTEDALILQAVGIYEYRHPLSDAVAYQAEIKRLQDEIKVMARQDGGAVLAATGWTVNGSLPKGRAMVRDYSKLVLRAYNAEADNLVRALKPYKLTSALERLARIALTIERLGQTMDIRISDAYHALRIKELELTADYLEKRAEEKERESADRERLREERRVQQELARERARLQKEHEHYSNVIRRLIEQGGHDAAAEHRATLAQIERAIQDVDYRVANVRAGYVYVISNLGAFGQRMIKVGLTRRIDPTERVRELGDASVPFRYDTHALFFSADAVGLEAKLHTRLADRRVNWVNKRREFSMPHLRRRSIISSISRGNYWSSQTSRKHWNTGKASTTPPWQMKESVLSPIAVWGWRQAHRTGRKLPHHRMTQYPPRRRHLGYPIPGRDDLLAGRRPRAPASLGSYQFSVFIRERSRVPRRALFATDAVAATLRAASFVPDDLGRFGGTVVGARFVMAGQKRGAGHSVLPQVVQCDYALRHIIASMRWVRLCAVGGSGLMFFAAQGWCGVVRRST